MLPTLDAYKFGLTRDKNTGPKNMDHLSFWLIYILTWCNLCIFLINCNNLKTAHSKMAFWDSLTKHWHIHVFVWVVKKGLTALRGLHSKFFYLSTMSRKTLSLAVNFQRMRCAIWYYLCNLRNVKNTHGGELLLVK